MEGKKVVDEYRAPLVLFGCRMMAFIYEIGIYLGDIVLLYALGNVFVAFRRKYYSLRSS